MKKLMQFLGFYGDEDYDEEQEDYQEKTKTSQKLGVARKKEDTRGSKGQIVPLRMVFCKGVPSDSMKLKLRDALLDGVMLLIDLHELDPRRFAEEGKPFIDFMGGVAFAHKGHMEFLEPSLYVVTPSEGMFEEWAEEDLADANSFNR